MEPRAKYAFVGFAVLAISGAIISFLLWLSEAGSLRHAKYFTVYFSKHTLYGLQQNSYVTMRGIKVGSVTGLEISPKNIEQIKVTLMLEGQAPVKTDTVALINRNLLTGFASIDLTKGTQEAPSLDNAPAGEAYPVIQEGKSEFDELTDSFPEMLEQVGGVLNRTQALLSEENVNSFSSILRNLDQFTHALGDNRENIEQTLRDLREVLRTVKGATSSVSDLSRESKEKLDSLGKDLSALVERFSSSFEGLQKQGRGALDAISASTQIIAQDISNATKDISRAASSLSSAAEQYERPRSIITGPAEGSLGPGEKRK